MKTETSFAGPQREARSNTLPRPRAMEGQRAAHAKEQPRQPTARDGDVLRAKAIMHGHPQTTTKSQQTLSHY